MYIRKTLCHENVEKNNIGLFYFIGRSNNRDNEILKAVKEDLLRVHLKRAPTLGKMAYIVHREKPPMYIATGEVFYGNSMQDSEDFAVLDYLRKINEGTTLN